MENRAVTYFREYLRIPSVHPDVDYSGCVTFLKRLAKENGLDCSVAGTISKPVVILTWHGSDKTAGSILLNSHMDVVPVFKEKWTYDPFAAIKDEKGDIYGRGAQDCKCIGIQYVEAIRRLIEEGFKPKRTVHITYVPDEEIGGVEGMKAFVKTSKFKQLNVAFALDEGVSSEDEYFVGFNEERCARPFKVVCRGNGGHGSLLHENTAGEKLGKVLDDIMDFRESQIRLLPTPKFANSLHRLAEVSSINLIKLEGGVQNNVVPPTFTMTFDLRLSIHIDHLEFFNWLQKVCSNAGDDVTYEVLYDECKVPKTVCDESNLFWMAMKRVLDEMNLNITIGGCGGASDARFLREIGVAALGFAPLRHIPFLAHCDDERLSESVFLEGINIYKNIIKALVMV